MYYENFERLCKEREVTPSQVSRGTEISTATLTSWKKGKYTPKQDKLQKIADFFHVSVDYLMTGKELEEDIYTDNRLRELNKELRNNTEFYNMVLKYLDLSEKKKKHVSELIDLLSE